MAVRCNLKFARMRAKLSQSQLGKLAGGILQENVSRMENGDMIPSRSQLRALAKVLRVKPTDLYSPEVIREIEAAEVVRP